MMQGAPAPVIASLHPAWLVQPPGRVKFDRKLELEAACGEVVSRLALSLHPGSLH